MERRKPLKVQGEGGVGGRSGPWALIQTSSPMIRTALVPSALSKSPLTNRRGV